MSQPVVRTTLRCSRVKFVLWASVGRKLQESSIDAQDVDDTPWTTSLHHIMMVAKMREKHASSKLEESVDETAFVIKTRNSFIITGRKHR